MISGKFLKSSLLYSLVGSLPLLSGFILLPFYTGDILSEKNYGYLTLHLAFALLFQSVFVFCLESFVGPIITENKQDKPVLVKRLSAINYYSLLFGGLCFILLIIIMLLVSKTIFVNDEPLQLVPFMSFTIITSFFNAYFKMYCNVLIYQEETKKYFIANVVNFIATITISVGALYYFGDTILGPLLGRLLSGVVIFLIAFLFLKNNYGCQSDSLFLKEIKRFSIPLLVFVVFSWLFNNSDRFFIEKMLSTELVGLFDFGIKCTLGIEIIFAGMNNAIYPKIYKLIKDNEPITILREHINKYASGYLIVIVLAIVFTLTTVPVAVTFLIKKTFYHKALAFLAILSIAQIFKVLYFIYLAPLFYFKRTDLVAKSFIFATIVQLLITYGFIYFFKLNGIIMAYVISKPLQIIFVYIESNRLIHLPINIIKQIYLPIILCVIVFAMQIFVKNNQELYYNPLVGLVLLLVTAFFYRNEVKPFYNEFIKKKILKNA